MIAAIINAAAWIAGAVFAFLLLKDFAGVERQIRLENEEREAKRHDHH